MHPVELGLGVVGVRVLGLLLLELVGGEGGGLEVGNQVEPEGHLLGPVVVPLLDFQP